MCVWVLLSKAEVILVCFNFFKFCANVYGRVQGSFFVQVKNREIINFTNKKTER